MQKRWYARDKNPIVVDIKRPNVPPGYWSFDTGYENTILHFPGVNYEDLYVDLKEAENIFNILLSRYRGDVAFVDFANDLAPNLYTAIWRISK